MFGKRKLVNNYNPTELSDFINDEANIFEVVDRLLSPKHNNILFTRKLDSKDFQIVVLDDYYEPEEVEEKNDIEEELNRYRERESNKEFINKYGNASVFLILGSLLISLGVIITIIMVLRGM